MKNLFPSRFFLPAAYASGILMLFVFVFAFSVAFPSLSPMRLVAGAAGFMSDTAVGQPEITPAIDASRITLADLDSYTPRAQVTGVTEDDENYYIAYAFSTIALTDGIWQDTTMDETLTVSKAVLGKDRDLGLYVGEQLKERIAQERDYLSRAQAIERTNAAGAVASSLYNRLIGTSVDANTDALSGYTPVVEPPEPQVEPPAPAPVANEPPPAPIIPVENPAPAAQENGAPESNTPVVEPSATSSPEASGSADATASSTESAIESPAPQTTDTASTTTDTASTTQPQ